GGPQPLQFRALGAAGGMAPPMAPMAADARLGVKTESAAHSPQSGAGAGQAPSVKVREYFPETMLWQPALITDERGIADLAVKFRIRAGKIGFQPLTVKAFGSKKSDAVKRLVEVVPNGERFEKIATDRLAGKAVQTVEVPAGAIGEASKLFVRLYPGVMAQIM